MDFSAQSGKNEFAMRARALSALGPHGFHKIHYTEWGDPENPEVVVCVHGLTRNSRDFDFLASALAKSYRVVCPDMPGRGLSDWLVQKEDYTITTYLGDIAVLLGRLNVEQVRWVGTSMGGLIGMFLATLPGSPVNRLILNDIGPQISQESQARIAQYLGSNPSFADAASAESYFRTVHAPFGPLTDEQWKQITLSSIKPAPEQGFMLRYDPGIAEAFRAHRKGGGSFWEVWDTIRCPVLVLRGAESDLLSQETASAMLQRGPRCQLVEFAGIGHAPALMSEDQIAVVRDWFSGE